MYCDRVCIHFLPFWTVQRPKKTLKSAESGTNGLESLHTAQGQKRAQVTPRSPKQTENGQRKTRQPPKWLDNPHQQSGNPHNSENHLYTKKIPKQSENHRNSQKYPKLPGDHRSGQKIIEQGRKSPKQPKSSKAARKSPQRA